MPGDERTVSALAAQEQKQWIRRDCESVAGRLAMTVLVFCFPWKQKAILLLNPVSRLLHLPNSGVVASTLPAGRSRMGLSQGPYTRYQQCFVCFASSGILCKRSQGPNMSPALSQSPIAQWDQYPNCQHQGIALCLPSLSTYEGTDTGVLIFVNEVPARLVRLFHYSQGCAAYTVSSSMLCSPDGSDLYSTLSVMSTAMY